MKLISKDRLSKAIVNTESFPFFHVENVFLENINEELIINDFPDIADGGSFHVKDKPSGDNIYQLVKELESDEFREILEAKFNLALNNAKVVTTLRGYSRKKDGKIHTDSKTKIVTLL